MGPSLHETLTVRPIDSQDEHFGLAGCGVTVDVGRGDSADADFQIVHVGVDGRRRGSRLAGGIPTGGLQFINGRGVVDSGPNIEDVPTNLAGVAFEVPRPALSLEDSGRRVFVVMEWTVAGPALEPRPRRRQQVDQRFLVVLELCLLIGRCLRHGIVPHCRR